MSWRAASYVAGYVRKKVNKREEPYTRVDSATGELVLLEREFSRSSRMPALGRPWVERYWRDVYPRDYVVMDGARMKPPRYYDKWMDAEHDPDSPAVTTRCADCREHQEVMMQVREKRYEEIVDYEDLPAREANHRARVALLNPRSKV